MSDLCVLAVDAIFLLSPPSHPNFATSILRNRKYNCLRPRSEIFLIGDLCDEVTKVGMAPRGVVKMVLDGLIDTLNMNINKGFSVQLGDFGCFRPGLNAKSQDKEEDVKSDTVYRRKIIFTPGQQFKEMLTRASVTRAGWDNSEVVSGGGSNPGTGGNGEEEEDPLG